MTVVTAPRVIRAAGCVVWRYGTKEPEVLLVHRPKYSDWSFPKGKLDRGETVVAAAVREVQEETGLRVRLGPALPDDRYTVHDGRATPKVVSYWSARAPKNADITTYRPNAEIDELAWVPVSKARSRLTYPRDVELLESFRSSGFDSFPLILIRHAQARKRDSWRGDDADRPLVAEGRAQAAKLATILEAYGVRRVVTSDAARCVETVLPYVNAHRKIRLRTSPALSQDECDPSVVRRLVRAALHSDRRVAICSHRPVLPLMFEALDIASVGLPPGGVVVVHRKGGHVVDLEQH